MAAPLGTHLSPRDSSCSIGNLFWTKFRYIKLNSLFEYICIANYFNILVMAVTCYLLVRNFIFDYLCKGLMALDRTDLKIIQNTGMKVHMHVNAYAY